MTKLEEEKLKEEIRGLKTNRIYDIIKGIALVLGALALFIMIQMPESVLNKKNSQETMNRERAKLILDVIHDNKDFENIVLELSVIGMAYPESDTIWLSDIKNIYLTMLDKQNNSDILSSIDSTKNKRIVTVRMELDELYDRKEKYQRELILEASGAGMSKKNGIGPIYRMIKNQIDKIDIQIIMRENELAALNESNK